MRRCCGVECLQIQYIIMKLTDVYDRNCKERITEMGFNQMGVKSIPYKLATLNKLKIFSFQLETLFRISEFPDNHVQEILTCVRG